MSINAYVGFTNRAFKLFEKGEQAPAAYYAGRADQMRSSRTKEWRALPLEIQEKVGKRLDDILWSLDF